MFSTPVEMKKISLTMMDVDAQPAAMSLAKLEVIHLLENHDGNDPLPEYPAKLFHEVYHSVKSRFAKIIGYLPYSLSISPQNSTVVSFAELEKCDSALKNIWGELSRLEERLRRIKEKIHNHQQKATSLQKFSALDLDLSRLHRQSRFLKIVVGTVPSANYRQLEKALSLANFIISPFYLAGGIHYVVVVGSSVQQVEVSELLQSADFREINVPQEFSGSPAQAQSVLNSELKDLNQLLNDINKKVMHLLETNLEVLQQAQDLLFNARPYASLDMVLKGKGGLVTLQGWIPAQRQQQVRHQLEQDLCSPFLLEFINPQAEELSAVPSLLKHGWILKPFQNLVSGFGIPAYTEIDPTRLFTLSYILMFGMMFGDVGHGLVIAVGSLFLWKSYPSVTIIAVLAGLSSAWFGLVYGSLFGYEHVITPLWMSPMEDPQKILLIAVGWGAGFILIANILAIRNALVLRQFELALYSGRGLAGLMFYLAIIFILYQLMQDGQIGALGILILVMPMCVILYYQWRQSLGSLSERLLVVAIEGLEHVISTVSGTLSFLRVAAFSLNHIALAAAVFSIAGMLDFTGHWITVVLGNIFIIVLEGAIVAIQCLRLEYYEGFSRFFSGKGKAFDPLKLET